MPLTANIISGKTSVWSRPRVDASRSASVPGSAAACPANAETPASSRRSANRSTPPIANTRTRPHTKIDGPSTASVPSTASLPRATTSPPVSRLLRPAPAHLPAGLELAEVGPDVDRAGQCHHEAAHRQDGLGQVAQVAGHEGLDEDADAGHAEDHEHRPQLGVLDGGLVKAHQRSPSCAVAGTCGPSSLPPVCCRSSSEKGLLTSSRGPG